MGKSIIISLILILIAAGGGFYGGTIYQKGQIPTRNANNPGQFAGRAGQNGGQAYRGQILSTDSTGITIKLNDGSTKIIMVSSSANVVKSDPGKLSDLKNGDEVTVFGSANGDGSINATMVQAGNTPGFGGRPSPMP